MSYATQHEERTAAAMGYAHTRTVERGSRFQKGSRNVWAIRDGWQTADLINNHYCNHQKFADLTDALRRPL
jgi:hypothetical protein